MSDIKNTNSSYQLGLAVKNVAWLWAEDQATGHGELHFPAVDRTGAQFFFNPEELIIFRYTVGPAE